MDDSEENIILHLYRGSNCHTKIRSKEANDKIYGKRQFDAAISAVSEIPSGNGTDK